MDKILLVRFTLSEFMHGSPRFGINVDLFRARPVLAVRAQGNDLVVMSMSIDNEIGASLLERLLPQMRWDRKRLSRIPQAACAPTLRVCLGWQTKPRERTSDPIPTL